MGIIKAPEKREVMLFGVMGNNIGKLVALELIKGTLAGKNYEQSVRGATPDQIARAKTSYDQVLNEFTKLLETNRQ